MGRDIGEHYQEEKKKEQEDYRKERIKQAVKYGNRAIAEGRYDIIQIVNKVLKDELNLNITNIDKYYRRSIKLGFIFNYEEIKQFTSENIDKNPTFEPLKSDEKNYNWLARQGRSEKHYNRQKHKKIFKSLITAAKLEKIIPSNFKRNAPVEGYRLVLGKRKLNWEYNIEKSEIYDNEIPQFVLITGATGAAKSTVLEAMVEDKIAHNQKIIDLHDRAKAENVVYDIEEPAEKLKNIREKLNLEVGFNENYKGPDKIEIYVPLSSEINDAKVPFDRDKREYKITPFTIPASEISKEGLRTAVRQTDAQAKYIDQAYDVVSREKEDWTLKDLYRELENTGMGADVLERVRYSLKNLQEKGYIRDKKDENTINWEDIFRQRRTVTSFTLMFMTSEIEKQIIFSYLLQKIKEKRNEYARKGTLSDYPMLTIAIRELQRLAPSGGKKSMDPIRKQIERASLTQLQDITDRMRHLKLEILADAQKFKTQLNKEVRSHADVIFTGQSQASSAKQVLKTRVTGSKYKDIVTEITQYDKGTFCKVDNKGYEKPLLMATPRCMHLETTEYSSGFEARAEHIEEEILRKPDFNTELEERFQIDGEERLTWVEWAENRTVKDSVARTTKDDIYNDYIEFTEENNINTMERNEFFRKFKEYHGLDDSNEHRTTQENGERKLTLEISLV